MNQLNCGIIVAPILMAVCRCAAAAEDIVPSDSFMATSAGLADTATLNAADQPVHLGFDIAADYRFGNIDGYVQTPSGGDPGTSSHHRPTFNELGVDTVNIFDFALAAHCRPSIFSAGGQIIRVHGDSTLSTDLTSHGTLFPAGSSVTSDIQLDWYRFGYQYEFSIDLGEGSGEFDLAPGVEADLLDFSYSLDGGGAHAHRSYAKPGLRIGGTIEWLTDSPFSVEATAFWGLPISDTVQVLSLDLVGRYQLWGRRNSGGSAFLGIGYESIQYEDNQTLSNHIKADIGPLLIAGLQVQF